MIVILENLRSAYNVGSVIRTCDAFGIKQVYCVGITPDLNNKKVLKTSLGAEKNISFKYFPDITQAISESKKNKFKVVAVELDKKAISLKDIQAEKKVALILGNEISGISEEARELSDFIVKIPMKGVKESLNVAVAFSIVAYDILSR